MLANLLWAAGSALALCIIVVLLDWARQEVIARFDPEPGYCCIKCHRMGSDLYYPVEEDTNVIDVLWAQDKADTADLLHRADLVLAGL